MTLPTRLAIVGDLERQDHYHLRDGMQCYFWGEYTPYEHTNGLKWNFSPTNQLISNFKKKMDQLGTPAWRYKQEAVRKTALAFSEFWKWGDFYQRIILIPMPPSRAREDRMYDPRMLNMLNLLAAKTKLPFDIRDCLSFTGAHTASHEADERPTPDELYGELSFNAAIGKSHERPEAIFLFDDMLTTGAHFVAATRVLEEHFPNVPVIGNFIARRIFPNPFVDLNNL